MWIQSKLAGNREHIATVQLLNYTGLMRLFKPPFVTAFQILLF
jgi:hypothetical protein